MQRRLAANDQFLQRGPVYIEARPILRSRKGEGFAGEVEASRRGRGRVDGGRPVYRLGGRRTPHGRAGAAHAGEDRRQGQNPALRVGDMAQEAQHWRLQHVR